MDMRKVVAIAALFCLGAALLLAMFPDKAAAQSFDQEMAGKKGMDSLGSKEFDQNKLPGKMKIGFAAGSFIAMIAAIKFL